jgi:predicted phage tail protein
MSLRKIKLYGKLGKICGKEWELDVSSVGEAIKAININTNGKLEKYLTTDGALKYYKVCIKNKNNFISEKEINTPYENGDIYIIPVIRGAGKNGIFQAILGVVLIVVGYFTGTMGVLGRVGLALVFGGVAQLLMAPKISDNGEQRGSFLFQGNATAASQGGPVGIVYGRAIVAPMPICLAMDNLDKNSYNGQMLE